ncbi:MAG: endonuclease domain-containing protein [Bacteroidales bacterium]|nr:endonuclease domain-containing protein [Bacteroidales bacterium]
MHFGAEAFGYKMAEKLRNYQTQAEAALWEELKNKKMDGIKFRRQHPINCFVVDFYCHSAKLIVELDGGIHKNAEVKEHDADRQLQLEEFGLKVIRFSNEEVLFDMKKTLGKIRTAINLQMKMIISNNQDL